MWLATRSLITPYSKRPSKQDIYDRLDTYYSVSPWTVYVYKEKDGDKLCNLGPLISMEEDFPIVNYGESSYYCRWMSFWNGIITLREAVDVDSPESSVAYDGKPHQWVPTVKAAVNPNFSDSDWTVSYYRGDNETADFTSAGEIRVLVQGRGNYSYFSQNYYYYTIEAADGITLNCPSQGYTYNGEAQGAAATASTPDGSAVKVEYSTNGTDWVTTAPTLTNAGEETVQVRATSSHYKTVTDSYTLKVSPAEVTVSIEGDTQTSFYSAQEQRVEGYTVSAPKDSKYDIGNVVLTGKETKAAGTTVGTYRMGLEGKDFSNNDPNYNVTFKVSDGKLTIEQAKVTAKIKGTSATCTYDGETHTVNGFEVTEVTDESGAATDLYDTRNVQLRPGKEAKASSANAGTYQMGLTGGDDGSFQNADGNFDVTFVVAEDGVLTINKRAIEVSDSATYTYNGQEQALSIDAAKVTNLVDGDRLYLNGAQVKGTEPGTYTDVTEYSWDVVNDGDNVTANYDLKVSGELVITAADNGNGSSDKADGSSAAKTGDSVAPFAAGAGIVALAAALAALLVSRKLRGARR